MYNQFTEIDQRPLNLNKVVLDPMQIPRPGKRRKVKAHSKNPYKIKKVRLLGEEAMKIKRLDGFALLKLLRFQHPKEIIRADISYRRIVEINPDHLEYFSNLLQLNCSENELRLEMLKKLPAVQSIDISHNRIRSFPLEMNGFKALRNLNLSFNEVAFEYIPHLAMMPELRNLNLASNDLKELPEDLSNFEILEQLDLSGNLFSSEYKAAPFWGSLATIPQLRNLSIARNRMRGIHTQRLAAGNFGLLQTIDFSFNSVENQHNLICARNFTELKKLIVTGNPFAVDNEYKGLEMEIYARTGAQLVVEPLNQYYLKKEKKEKCPIRFEKLVKVETDSFAKNRNVLMGLQMPKDDFSEVNNHLLQSEEEAEEEEEEPEDDNQEEPMFVTEQINVKKEPKSKDGKSAKSSKVGEQEQPPSLPSESHHGSREPSEQSVKSDRSLKYDEFKKVAAELLGGQKDYARAFDINTAYKALKNVVSRVRNE